MSERDETCRNGIATEETSLLRPPQINPHERPKDTERVVLVNNLSRTRFGLIMLTTWVGFFLGAADSTVIAALSAPISSEFKSLSLLSWLATAYLISNAACQPISGRLTDIFGRGPGLIFSNLTFALGNLICGLAQSEHVMILGRVVAGIGGGGLMSIAAFLTSDLVPLRQRGIMYGLGNIWYGAGGLAGSVLGGFFNDYAKMGWRLAFLVQVPPGIVCAIAAAILVRIPPKQSDKSYLARIDYLGALLTTSFLVLLLLGLNSGGNMVPWTHPLPLTTISLSILTFIGFLYWESKAAMPIIPVRLLVNRTILAACVTNFLTSVLYMAALFFVPLYLQVRGCSTADTGVKMLPAPVGLSVGAMGAGYIVKKAGRSVEVAIGSISLLVIGATLFALQSDISPIDLASWGFFFIGMGYGASVNVTLLGCIAALDHSEHAVVTSAIYLFRSLGMNIGVTVASATYQDTLKAQLWQRFGNYPHAGEIIGRIRDDLEELKNLPEGWYDGVMQSFVEAFRGVWFLMVGAAVSALLCVSLMRQYKLHSTLDRED